MESKWETPLSISFRSCHLFVSVCVCVCVSMCALCWWVTCAGEINSVTVRSDFKNSCWLQTGNAPIFVAQRLGRNAPSAAVQSKYGALIGRHAAMAFSESKHRQWKFGTYHTWQRYDSLVNGSVSSIDSPCVFLVS